MIDEVEEVLVTTAIEVRAATFDAVWGTQPAVKLLFANVRVKTPPVVPYVRLWIRFGQGVDGEAFAGNRIDYRKLGLITAQIFTGVGIGAKQGKLIGGVFKKIFQGQQFFTGGTKPILVTCREYELTEVGVDPKDATLYGFNARVPFDYHESTTY